MTKITNFIEPYMKDGMALLSLRSVCEFVKTGRITLGEIIAAPSFGQRQTENDLALRERITELLDAERQYEAVGKRFWHEP